MRIQGPNGPTGPKKPEKADNARAVDPTERSASVPQDRIEMSPDARLMASLTQAAARLPEVRQDRVDAARRAGSAIDPHAVARAIQEFEDGLH